MAIDTVTLNIIHNALTNIASEMALVMLKTSYSTIFNEGLDFTTVLLDRHGDLIAEKNYTPSMMGAIPAHGEMGRGGKGDRAFPSRRRPRPQRLLPGRLSSPRAHDDATDVRRRSALRVRRQHRTRRRDRRQGPGLLRRRRHRHLPGRVAPASGQAARPRRVRRGRLAHRPRQPPHAAQHLGRFPRHDRLAGNGRATHPGVGRALRRRH